MNGYGQKRQRVSVLILVGKGFLVDRNERLRGCLGLKCVFLYAVEALSGIWYQVLPRGKY
jgi:hypothetical protein